MRVIEARGMFNVYIDKVTQINSLFNDSKTTVIYIKWILNENEPSLFNYKVRMELNKNHGLNDFSEGDNIEFEACYSHSIEEGWLKIGKPYNLRKVN